MRLYLEKLAIQSGRFLFVGDDERLIRWIKRETGISKATIVGKSFEERWSNIFYKALEWIFLSPASDFERALGNDGDWLDYAGVAVRMIGEPANDGRSEHLSLTQINRIRQFLDTSKRPFLLFGPYDIGVGQIVLSRLPNKRYTGMRDSIERRLRAFARHIRIPRIPDVKAREVASILNPEECTASQAKSIRSFSVLDEVARDHRSAISSPAATVHSLDSFVPAYAWEIEKTYLQQIHMRVPSIREYRRNVKAHNLRELANRKNLDLSMLTDAVEKPVFDFDAFTATFDPDPSCMAKFVRNARGGFDIRRSSQRLTEARTTSALSRESRGLGFYAQPARRSLTLLILLGFSRAWEATFLPSNRLLEIYNQIVALLGRPGFTFRDPGGLIVTWSLVQIVPDSDRLVREVEEKLSLNIVLCEGEEIQIRPQPAAKASSALLVPEASSYVVNDTLFPCPYNGAQAGPLDPNRIFGSTILFPPPPQPRKTVHRLGSADITLIAKITAACPGSPEDKSRLQTFLESLIPHLHDLEENPKANHCHVKGPNVFAVQTKLLKKWGYQHAAMREWLENTKIFYSDRAYTPGGECLNPKTKCYKFNWRPALEKDARAAILKDSGYSVAQLAKLCGLEPGTVKKYRQDPNSMPLSRYLVLHKATRVPP